MIIAESFMEAMDKLNDLPSQVCGPCGGKGVRKFWKNEGHGVRYWLQCEYCNGTGLA